MHKQSSVDANPFFVFLMEHKNLHMHTLIIPKLEVFDLD